MRLEARHVTGSHVAAEWGSEPDLRADIKMGLAEQLGRMMRTRDLIDYVVTTADNGDTVITASIEAASTGDERRAALVHIGGTAWVIRFCKS